MLFSLAFLVLLLFSHSLQTTAHEKKTKAERSHRSLLVNHSPNVNNNPPSSSKATHYLTSANQSLASTATSSDEKTSQNKESPSSAQHPIKVLISNAWFQKDTSKHTANSTLLQDKELDLERGSPLVLTHQINLVPGACGGCEAEFANLQKRLDHLEREVSTLKQNCACAKGAACFPQSDENECPNDCSDQGRCEGGRCVCFPGFNGHDCGTAVCPSDCSNNGQCVNGQCVCDNGYSGLECANKSCPGNCNNQGQCVKGTCVSHPGVMGTDCCTAPSGSVHLRSRDITDSSVTLFWTQPSVQYSTYRITFTSLRDGGRTIQANVGGRALSFTQTGLAAGQKYKMSIRGERDGKMGPESTTEFTTAPSGSVHLRSRDITDSSVTLFWTQPSIQYITYHITFTSLRDGGRTIKANVGGRALSFTQTGLAAGQKYEVSIRGERDGKMGPESTTEFTTAPAGSVHLRSRDITDSSVTLFWTQPSIQYITYHITFTSLRDGGGTIQANVGGRALSFTQTGLAAGQKYKVSIRGERDGKMGPEGTTEFMTAPSGSVHLRSRDITDSSVTLFWTQPSVQYSTYDITFTSLRDGGGTIQANVGGRLSSFTQTGLAAGQKYKVSIRGERDGKMGPESTTEFTTAPSGSVNLRSRDITDSSVYLFWTQPSVQYSTYHITFKSQREEDKMIQVKIGGRLTSFTQTGLAAGQKYKVSIRGERDGKMGPESTTEFTTAPYGSIYFQTRDTTDSSVTLFWTQPSVQYSTYHITFKSQREGEKIIQAKIEGRLTSFTQTGLAAGQKYKVSIRGERDGKMGPESTTEFTAAPSGSVHLRSRDITDSSVTLSWTQPSVQYSNYHVTFKSQREGDKMITAKVSGRALSFTQTGLAAGQKYKVSIRGERDGKMGPENNIEFTTVPSGSIYLQTRDATDSSVTLFWTQPSVQYSTYHITFKSQREGDKMIQAEIEGRLTSFTQTVLAASQKYKVSIRGERDGKMGPESTTEFRTAPSGTVHLRSRDITDSSVILFWTQPSVLYSTYHITLKSQKVGDKILTTKVGGRLTSFSQTGLAAGQRYKVSIRGERDGKMGPESTTEFTTALSGSVHFRSKDITDSSVTLFWTQPSVQYSTYHITFKSQREREKMITAKVGGRTLSFTQTGLAAGQKYKVSIRGERDGKMGPENNVEFTTVPSGSIYLQTRDATDSSVTLFWTQPSVQYSTYHITFKSQREGDKMIQAKVEGRLTSFTQTGLAAGQKYKVSIRGKRDGKMGPESTAEFTTAPSGSVHLRSRDITDSSVTLFWTQPSVQYSTYHITFKSKGEGDKIISAKVGGRITNFTQTGLAAGQKYKVSIRGERDGKMGPESTTEFTTAQSGSVHLRSRDITDSSVTLFWTQPSVQYSAYHITFKSQKEGDEAITHKVGGRLTRVTQTGLAAGQKYKVSIRGERDGKMGPESITEFTTDISGPRNLHILKTTQTSVLVQWESPMGDIDSYRLSISPSLTETKDRKNEGQETILPPDTDAANIDGLEEGRLYYITLIARKGRSQSQPIRIQAVPGNSKNVFNKMIVETVITKLQPEGDIITEKKTNKTTLHKTLFVKNEEVKKKDNEKRSRAGDHSSKTKQDTYKKTDVTTTHRIEKTVLGSEAVTLRTASAGGGTGVTAQGRRKVTSQTLLKQDATRGPEEWSKVTRPDSRHDSKHHSKVLSKPDLKTHGTKSTAKANQTISEKDKENNAKQVSQMANVTKTEFSHKIAIGQLMQAQSEDRELETGGNHMVRLKNDSSIIRKGTQGVPSSLSAVQIDRATKISSSAPFYSSSQTRHIHSKIGHKDTSSQTSVKAMIRPSTHHKNTFKTDIPQTDITSSRTRNMGSTLYSVEVRNITSRGFIIIWEVPQGMFQSFVVTRREYALGSGDEEGEEENTEEEEEERSEMGTKEDSAQSTVQRNITYSYGKSGEGNRTHQFPTKSHDSTSSKNIKKVSQVIPGNARSLTFRNLQPNTRYSLTLFGVSSGMQSKIHHVTITTGPESPSELLFSNVTDSSLSVSWAKPKGPITGFKVTYTNTEDGESISVSADTNHSSVTLSQLSPGSSYEVSVVSVLGLKESDPVKGLVITVPDPPTGLRAVNITDTKALLVWKPAMAKVDRYIIIFGSEKVPDITVKVSGNNAEHQLKGLLSGTVYTVTVTSQLDSLQSTGTTTTFTTAGGSGIRREEVPQEMSVSQLTPRTVVLSWKSPNMVVTSYRLTYQRAEQEAKEVTLASTMTKFKLTGLSPLSKYTVQVQGERNGRYITVMATEFKTGSLLFPFPTDCSQELLNGMQQSGEVEVFPAGRQGRPVWVYCDMETDGGGWTVFQRRINGVTNFFRGWNDYSYGFGNLSGEFWLGNENIHNLTSLRPMALRVDLRAGAESAYAHYSFFYIDGQRKHYALRVSGYSGTAGDSMRYYGGRPFSTHDKDPLPISTHCAINYRGGWWHKNCQKANINGLYSTGTTHQGVIWTDWKGKESSVAFTEMKLRPASFPSRTHS